jgi:hypothetical protein
MIREKRVRLGNPHVVRLKEGSLNCGEAKVGTALSADWMRPSRFFQSKGGGLGKSNFSWELGAGSWELGAGAGSWKQGVLGG